MRRPNPSCTNPICGPVLHAIESHVGVWDSPIGGYDHTAISQIMQAKASLWTPKVLRPQRTDAIPFDTVVDGTAARGALAWLSRKTIGEMAQKYWQYLWRTGRVD